MTEPKKEKCEACCGSGYINFWTDDGHISMRTCRRCDGYGYIKVEPMTKLCNTCEYLKFCARSGIEEVGCDRYQKDTTTNEEWLRSCTTEELAKYLQSISVLSLESKDEDLEDWKRWLKEIHE